MRKIPVEQQLQELREAVVAMAIALGGALPATREFISKIDALVDTAAPPRRHMATKRNFEPEHRIDMWQARCTNCGYIETDYGDYNAWADPGTSIESVTEAGWFSRWSYAPNPTPDNPRGKTGTLEELLCGGCQECEVCGAKPASGVNGLEHLVCPEHEEHEFQ